MIDNWSVILLFILKIRKFDFLHNTILNEMLKII